MPDKSVEQMQLDIASISSTQELVDVYVQVHNKFWYIEDDLYDYEEESDRRWLACRDFPRGRA